VVTSLPDPARRLRRAGRIALLVLFLSFLDVFALLPTLAPFATELGAGPTTLGLVVGAYSAANLPANLVGGALVDRVGRRPVLLTGLVLAAVAVASYPLATTTGMLIAIRLFHGAAGGVLVPAVFAVAGDGARVGGGAGRTMGRAGAVIGAAAVVAPASAGALRQAAGTEAVFRSVGALLLLGAIIVALGVRETGGRSHPARAPASPADARDDRRARAADRSTGFLRDRTVRRTLTAVVATTAAVGVLAGFLPGSVERAGASPAVTGGLFTAYAVVAAALMLSPLAARVDREGPHRPVVIGLGALAVAMAVLTVTEGVGGAVFGVVVFGLGYGLVFPAASGAISLAASDATRGRAFGWFNVAFSLGLAVGPPIAGGMSEAVPAVDPFLVVAAGCAVTVLALLGSARGGVPPRTAPRRASPYREAPRRASDGAPDEMPAGTARDAAPADGVDGG
jgi:MFS transporter, DHA1 family, multidrug resistance protein